MQVYKSDNFDNLYEYRVRTIGYPIAGNFQAFEVTRYYMCHKLNVPIPTFTTKAPEFIMAPNTCYLCSQSEVEHVDGEMVRFTGTFRNTPLDYSDFSTYVYTFPGFSQSVTASGKSFSARESVELHCTARILYNFVHTSTPQDLALTEPQRWKFNVRGTIEEAPAPVILNNGGGTLFNSMPSLTEYAGWIVTGKEIVPEWTTLERYAGNVWRRATIFVRCQ